MFEYLHYYDEHDDHEHEARPRPVVKAEVGVFPYVVAHAVFRPIHFRIDEHDERAPQRIDESGENRRTGCGEYNLRQTFPAVEFERCSLVEIALIYRHYACDRREQRRPHRAVNDEEKRRGPEARREEQSERRKQYRRDDAESIYDGVQYLAQPLTHAEQRAYAQREDERNDDGRYQQLEREHQVKQHRLCVALERAAYGLYRREEKCVDEAVV